MNRISAFALAFALGCAGSVYAASPQDNGASGSGTTTHQVGSDFRAALHKMGAATRSALHRASAALHRTSHNPGKSTGQS